MKLERR